MPTPVKTLDNMSKHLTKAEISEREILSYASKLGLTPESRARLAKRIAEHDEDDPDGDLFA